MLVKIGVANGERKSTNLHTSEQEMQSHLAVLLIFDHGIPSADMEKQVEGRNLDNPGGLDHQKTFLVILPAGPASEAFLNHPENGQHVGFTTWIYDISRQSHYLND